MEITNIKSLIENKLAIIDIFNKDSEGIGVGPHSTRSELLGIKQALHLMGFRLDFETNPYFYDDKKPSTYTLTLEDAPESSPGVRYYQDGEKVLPEVR